MKRLFPGSWNRIVPAGAALAAAIALLAPCAAQATPYVVKLIQKGNNVVAVGHGSIDLTGLTLYGGIGSTGSSLIPNVAEVDLGPAGALDYYTGISGPTSFGSGGETDTTTGAGPVTAVLGLAVPGVPPGVAVPQKYSNDTPLPRSSATWDNASFTSLGVTSGVYTWTWGTRTGDQSFTLDAFVGVPEPAALGMLGFGLLLVGGFLKLRPRQPGSA
ncbi:MAG TPA: PEP-CTERM sorting domain-containing protein [Rhodanobacteraceae bacterium]|nr:PEP-CTERM sorting domain-containing protein [Rhodanobacteraceae bacterium]